MALNRRRASGGTLAVILLLCACMAGAALFAFSGSPAPSPDVFVPTPSLQTGSESQQALRGVPQGEVRRVCVLF